MGENASTVGCRYRASLLSIRTMLVLQYTHGGTRRRISIIVEFTHSGDAWVGQDACATNVLHSIDGQSRTNLLYLISFCIICGEALNSCRWMEWCMSHAAAGETNTVTTKIAFHKFGNGGANAKNWYALFTISCYCCRFRIVSIAQRI